MYMTFDIKSRNYNILFNLSSVFRVISVWHLGKTKLG